jgi:hypothetical protein
MNHDGAYSEVLSAFLDSEPFDPAVLSAALAEPEGRALLMDLIALRQMTRTNGEDVPAVGAPRVPVTRRWQFAAAVAVFIPLAMLAGYGLGRIETSNDAGAQAHEPAPQPTREIVATWQDGKGN